MMFGTPYFQIDVKDWEIKKPQLMELMNSQKFCNHQYDTVNTTYDPDVADSHKNEDEAELLSKKVESILKSEIEECINAFRIIKYEVQLCWFQEQTKGMYHSQHNHGYKLSSVCYLEYDPEHHSPITFISPSPEPLFGDYVPFQPHGVKEGTIIFFPGVINHCTVPQESDVPRKILSFNIGIHFPNRP